MLVKILVTQFDTATEENKMQENPIWCDFSDLPREGESVEVGGLHAVVTHVHWVADGGARPVPTFSPEVTVLLP